ncbi:MAG: hypothetical protein O3A33_00010 [Chloroflexi bacterium]|nr:hypothetical protein [Chloroflexota bacterium]
MTLRIRGLVRAFNEVRARLQAGIPPAEAHELRRYAGAIVERVEELCAKFGTKPTELPAPSRKAYRYLKELESNRMPSSGKNSPSPSRSVLKISRVVKITGLFSKRMWDELAPLLKSAESRDHLKSEMQEFVTEIEKACSGRGATPSSLGAPSRRAYCWLKFLLDGDNLMLHLSALDRGRSALAQRTPESDGVELHMANMNSTWRRRNRGKLVSLKSNEGFLYADEIVWQALIGSSVSRGGDGKARGVVNEYIESEEFSGVLFEMESHARLADESTAGRVHSLDKSFDRVNTVYFSGSIRKPQLCWNNVITSRKFGHYESARDTVMLSISLDDTAVPEELVDYVMYHELLHKKHGVRVTNGRRMAHTSAFRKDEKRFLVYEDAVAKLNALARRHGAR